MATPVATSSRAKFGLSQQRVHQIVRTAKQMTDLCDRSWTAAYSSAAAGDIDIKYRFPVRLIQIDGQNANQGCKIANRIALEPEGR
jgi:hypothetical protein